MRVSCKKIADGIACLLITGILFPLIGLANPAASSVWSSMAQNDLSVARAIIIKNVPKAQVKNSHYMKWLNAGYQQTEAMAKQVDTYAGYISVMQYYLSGFNDYHTDVRALLKNAHPSDEWPGFIVGLKNGRIVVTDAAHQSLYKLPPLGANLLGCDHLSVKQLITKNIVPFYLAVAQYPSTWTKYVPYLFVWQQNPFIQQAKVCRFMVNGQQQRYSLHWQPINNPSPLSPGVMDFQQKMYPFKSRKISIFLNFVEFISIPCCACF